MKIITTSLREWMLSVSNNRKNMSYINVNINKFNNHRENMPLKYASQTCLSNMPIKYVSQICLSNKPIK